MHSFTLPERGPFVSAFVRAAGTVLFTFVFACTSSGELLATSGSGRFHCHDAAGPAPVGSSDADIGVRFLPGSDLDDVPPAREWARYDTLWILDADFEDVTSPGNTGWIVHDLSGSVGNTNYWHLDTFNAHGDTGHSWWCGTHDECWVSPHGYGNNWISYLEHDFDFSQYTESITLEFRQKFAMEHDHDYGYVDAKSSGTGGQYLTLAMFTNPGFAGKPGVPQGWDSPTFGHWEIDMSGFLGEDDVSLRFRFESNGATSSGDCAGEVCDALAEGAWYIDEITITADGETAFHDDCEQGQGGWRTDDIPPGGQTGVVFRRMQIFFESG